MVERTLIIIKPDSVQRHLVGEIIRRFEKKGLKLVAAKFLQLSEKASWSTLRSSSRKSILQAAGEVFVFGARTHNGLGS